jgi:hypothetical protein
MKALIDVVNTGKSDWENITPPGPDEMIAMYEKWPTELLEKVAALDDASEDDLDWPGAEREIRRAIELNFE